MNYKENPRNFTITFRVTEQEKEELQKLAKKKTGGKMSLLIQQACLAYLEKEKNV